MKKLLLISFVAILGSIATFAQSTKIWADDLEIGPGQVKTINIYLANAPIVKSFGISFDLPEGVYIAGIDSEVEACDVPTDAFTMNPDVNAPNASFYYDSSFEVGKLYFSTGEPDPVFSEGTKITTEEGDWFIKLDVVCLSGTGGGKIAFDAEFTEVGTLSYDDMDVTDSETTQYANFVAKMAGSGYTSICSTADLDFSAVEGLTAYVVSEANGEKAKLAKIENAPAGTGVILKGEPNTTYEIPTGAASAPETNQLVGVTKVTPLAGDGSQFFLVGGKFVKAASKSVVPAGKAYLVASAGAKAFDVLDIEFDDDEATAIKNVENEQFEGVIYNLNGVRVDNPTKGVYVKDGKKFVVK